MRRDPSLQLGLPFKFLLGQVVLGDLLHFLKELAALHLALAALLFLFVLLRRGLPNLLSFKPVMQGDALTALDLLAGKLLVFKVCLDLPLAGGTLGATFFLGKLTFLS